MTKDIMIQYAGLENMYGFNLIKDQLKELETTAGHSFSNTQLIVLLSWANKNNRKYYGILKSIVKTMQPSTTAEEIGEQLET